METNNNTNELELMRSQLDIMKKKLDSQNIVNEQLMRKAWKQKMSGIRRYLWVELIVLLPLCLIMALVIKKTFMLNCWFVAFSAILFCADVASDFYVNRFKGDNLTDGNLLKVAERLTWMKKMRLKQLYIGVVFAVIWVGWIVYGALANHVTHGEVHLLPMIIGGSIGLVVGLAVGVKIVVKMNRTNDRIINEIKEMTQE